MTESETTKNTLYQLEEKMNREHWGDIQLFEEEDNRYSIAVGKAILLIKELEQYRAIGTVEELQALKYNQRKCEDCAGCTNWLCDCSSERAKAVDEFVKEIEAEYDNDGCPNVSDYLDYKISIRDLQKIAEHLKGGATDEG